jgi:hypothetical protein
MTASVWHPRTAQKVVLVLVVMLIAIVGTLHSASALTPEQCYRRDSGCTQFCGEVTGDLRYECFRICDRMLNRCLDTGEWTDSASIDPGTGRPPNKRDLLSGFVIRSIMTLGDTDGDGVLSPKEIQSLKERLFRGLDASPKTPGER